MPLDEYSNLVSFYILPEDNSVEGIMNDILPNIEGIIAAGSAAIYDSSMGWVGSLVELDTYSGYWLTMEQSDTLDLSGSPLNPFQVYDLQENANLISFPVPGSVGLSEALPDDIEGSVGAVLTQNSAALQIEPGIWVGTLQYFNGLKGYWFIVDTTLSFAYNLDGLARSAKKSYVETQPADFNYSQSSAQAFYFVHDVILRDSAIEVGDWILSYCGEVLSGIRQWQGEYMDVPVMGTDGSERAAGYCSAGETPHFKLLTQTGETINLTSENIPKWSSQATYLIGNLLAEPPLPEEFSLRPAYPNPFNPVTTIEFGLPVETEVMVEVYNLQGRLIETLTQSNFKAGYHTVIWNADRHASGMYFVQMTTSNVVKTQKLMLVK
jgi:hypothetical protein